jgi:hypothetical protein
MCAILTAQKLVKSHPDTILRILEAAQEKGVIHRHIKLPDMKRISDDPSCMQSQAGLALLPTSSAPDSRRLA